jgi:cytochrome c peroxidase
MLSPQTKSTNYSSFTILLATTLICALKASCAYAEDNAHYRQEPIFPIPLKVEVESKKAELGELLFFDTRLSSNNQIACASCHQLEAGGDDNVALGISMAAEQHIINTPSIFNSVYNFRQNWDGSTKTLQQQVDAVLKSRHAFDNNWDDVIVTLSKDALLSNDFYEVYQDGFSKENIIDAIVEFEKTLTTPNSRFDRYLRNEDIELSDEEIRGYLTFKELGCISCHQGVNIGGNLYQKFGVFYNYIAERGDIKKPDYGRMNATNRQMDAFVFKVPSLRNIAVTAPYLHDGSAATIEEAISIMGKTQLGRALSTEEIDLIKSFLGTLTGEYKNKPLDGAS